MTKPVPAPHSVSPGIMCSVAVKAGNVKLKGSYEWQTGGGEKSSLMNSWEMGISTSLTFPRVVFPRFSKREFDFPATTTFRLYIDQLNRARYYKLLSFGGNATYDSNRHVPAVTVSRLSN